MSEDQRLPFQMTDDAEYNDAVSDYNHRLWLQDHPLCRVCGDTVCLCDDPGCEYASIIGTTVGGRVACLGPCVATLVAERWCEELAARVSAESEAA